MMRAYRFYLITIGMIFFIFMLMTITVNATESKRLQHQNEYYEELEEEYVRALRKELTDSGYRNAGITMTKVFYEDGTREYTVRLHHKKMEYLTVSQQNELLDRLAQTEFAGGEHRVYLKFL